MGLIRKFFNKKNKSRSSRSGIEIISGGGNFFSWGGELYQSDIVRACIRPKAKAVGKLTGKHVRESDDGLKINPDAYMRFLLEEPNPYMTGQMLQEKLAMQLALNNNAFALIVRDEYGYPSQIYPIPCRAVRRAFHKSGELFLDFLLSGGKELTAPYGDIIHLRQDFNNSDLFGDSPADVLVPLMEIVGTTDQGVVKAVKSSNAMKWILKYHQSGLRDEDLKGNVKKFVDNYLSIDADTGGAMGVDAKFDVEQIKPQSYVPEAEQMSGTVRRLYNFFNTNEKIVQSKYNENEWTSYYESEIEPFAMQLSGEYTRKLFSRRERGFGNKIIFEASNLQYAAMRTKLGLVSMVDRGSMTPNEWRRILNLGPIEGGDKPIRRLDTAVVEGGDIYDDDIDSGDDSEQ